ncbi:ISAs1 family transposase [Lentimicrobium saccharophilum]|nr:ISAs1 family transposase [Lentimicrobium saccharophilum]
MQENGLMSYFSDMKDPRIERTKRHLMNDILFISIAAVLSGVESWDEMELYGKNKQHWLSTILELPNGIPSHDTFNRFFAALDPDEFESRFLKWVASLVDITSGETIHIDGKTMRGSRKQGCKSATHIVSAWADQNELILGQIKVEDKSNEITAIPLLLDSLLIKGSTVTIDAMGCQKSIARQIVKKQADYVLSVKDNQPELLEEIVDSFRMLPINDYYEEVDYGHGRIENRKCSIITDLSLMFCSNKWAGLKSVVKIERERIFKATGKVEKDINYYISTLTKAPIIGKSARKHWGIENKVHWVLDVAFGEDLSRKRDRNAAQNFSSLNRIAINLLKKNNLKVGIKSRRKICGWDNEFLLKTLKN